MTNFFAKSRAETSVSSAGLREATEATDFDKVFKPFALKKGVEVAPTNYFGAPLKTLDGIEENPIIVLDGETLLPPPFTPVMHSSPTGLPGVVRISPHSAYPLNPFHKIASVM